MSSVRLRRVLGRIIFMSRWILYPINIVLICALLKYVGIFLYEFAMHGAVHELETKMVDLLGLVDAAMVANLVIMIVQGGHQIFIHKFELPAKSETPQYLDHIDTGILKVKVALSISSITLVQILKDFVNIEHVDWDVAAHRMWIHGAALISAFMMAAIWRITHPPQHNPSKENKDETH